MTTTTTRPPIDEPFVEVNGVRLVYASAGEGDRTVLVDQWMFISYGNNAAEADDFMGWQTIVDGVKDNARICVYNRRGVGNSDNRRDSLNRTTQNMVDDLAAVIKALDLDPVVIVGHSLAGFNIRLLADQHPDLISGAVFVEASHPDQVVRMPPSEIPPIQPPEYIDIWASHREVTGRGNMGDKPIYVLTAGLMIDPTTEEGPIWLELQQDHAAQSTNSRHAILPGVGHELPGYDPQAVITAINWVIAQLTE